MFFPQLQARFDIHKNAPRSLVFPWLQAQSDIHKKHHFRIFSRFPHGYKRDLIFTKSVNCVPLFCPRLQARFDIHKKCQLNPFRCFPNGYKRDLIFTKSANCIHSVVFLTATSAIWYSHKVAIALIPLFSSLSSVSHSAKFIYNRDLRASETNKLHRKTKR